VTSDLEHLVVSDEVDDEALNAPATPVHRSPRIGQADVLRTADERLKLGARLRDVPGREFPQLPERTAKTLLSLWNEALAGAKDTLRGEVAAREQALTAAAAELSERAALAARAAGLEESIALAQDQLLAANQRADRQEAALAESGRRIDPPSAAGSPRWTACARMPGSKGDISRTSSAR
jgi:hypothetical protein